MLLRGNVAKKKRTLARVEVTVLWCLVEEVNGLEERNRFEDNLGPHQRSLNRSF